MTELPGSMNYHPKPQRRILVQNGNGVRAVDDWPERKWSSYEKLIRYTDAVKDRATVAEVVDLYMHDDDLGVEEFERLLEKAMRREPSER